MTEHTDHNFHPDDIGVHAVHARGVVKDVELLTYDGPSADIEQWIERENAREVPFLHWYRQTTPEDRHIEGYLLFLPYLRQSGTDWFRAVPNPAANLEQAREWAQDFLRDHYRNHPEAMPQPAR